MVLSPAIQPIRSTFFFRIMSGSVIMWFLFFGGCQPEAPRQGESTANDIQKIEFNGFTIPVFPTAAEQLAYAKSRIGDAREKEATLKLMLNRFSQDTHTCALARLDLAYLSLGTDYRLADPDTCRRALTHYHQITRTYADLPGVCAKAYWYMGWIYTDLLGDKHRGAAMYQQVIDRYASEWMTIESLVPRIRHMVPEKPEETIISYDRQNASWADLALLEIVKNDDDPINRHHALMTLWARKSTGPATGLALLSALKSSDRNVDDAVIRMAREYIQQHAIHQFPAQDIETALAICKHGDPEK